MPIWSEVELAWRLSRPDKIVPWLGITGTNGKTTTTQMLESILAAAGLRTAAVGNIGRPIMEIVLDPQPYDVLAVELSSHQLHWSDSLAMHSAAVLNVQPDHLEWHGSYDAYRDAKARIYAGVQASCVYNVADPATEQMVEQAEVVEGARAIGFTLGTPGLSMLGVVDDLLVDRAFIEQRRDSALELAKISDVSPAAPHNVANALAAAALARSYGVPAAAVRKGLRTVKVGPHKIQTVLERDGVSWVDDSKATNPHAADAALRAFSSVVWIAGGQAKGTTFDELVTAHRKGCVAPCCSGSTARSLRKPSLDTHPKSPRKSSRRSTLEQWHKPLRRPLPWPDLVMLSCSRRGAPARTCSPTTPPAGMPSLPRCARSQRSRRQWRP